MNRLPPILPPPRKPHWDLRCYRAKGCEPVYAMELKQGGRQPEPKSFRGYWIASSPWCLNSADAVRWASQYVGGQ